MSATIPHEWFGQEVRVIIDRSQWPKDWYKGKGYIVDDITGILVVFSQCNGMPYGIRKPPVPGYPPIPGYDGIACRFDASVLHTVRMSGERRLIVIRPTYRKD